MKRKAGILFLLPLFLAAAIQAQLTITPGSQFSATGNIQVTLNNFDLINNGNLATGNSRISFVGNAPSSINGTQSTQFSRVEINKTNSQVLKLLRGINVTDRISFTSGFLDLNGFIVDLGTTGQLEGEQENSRIVGLNGGDVRCTIDLNSPANVNPANLGVMISSNQNLGNVIIKRGHQSQPGITGVNKSIFRYYDLATSNSGNLATTLRIKYFNGEVNGIQENTLSFFKSDNTINWSALGFTSRDTVVNYTERNGLINFSRFTLSAGSEIPLAVNFVFFNVRCETNKTVIAWSTAQEQNSNRFDIERSDDGVQWKVVGNVPAAGNSVAEKDYSFNDDQPAQGVYYRVAEYDQDGTVRYTQVLRSSCYTSDLFTVQPNPAHNTVFINIIATHSSQATIRLFDNKGALVKIETVAILQGSNQLKLDLVSLANGLYTLQAEWDEGRMKESSQVLKQ